MEVKYTEQQIRDNLILFLIHSHDKILTLVLPLKEQYNIILQREDKLLHEDITKEFYSLVMDLIREEAAKALDISPEEAAIAVEGLKVENYINS